MTFSQKNDKVDGEANSPTAQANNNTGTHNAASSGDIPADSPEGAILPGSILPHLEIVDITLEGQGVARQDGRVVFLDSGLPGEVVSARVVSIKKRLVYAEIINTIQPSPYEARPFCHHFGECGGCSLQNFAYDQSLAWKQRQVAETLRRIGGVEFMAQPVGLSEPVEPAGSHATAENHDKPHAAFSCDGKPVAGERAARILPVLPSPRTRGFRNKMAFAFGFSQEGRPVLGLARRASAHLVEITGCILQDSAAMQVLDAVREFARKENMTHWKHGAVHGKGREKTEKDDLKTGSNERTAEFSVNEDLQENSPSQSPEVGELRNLVIRIPERPIVGDEAGLDGGAPGSSIRGIWLELIVSPQGTRRVKAWKAFAKAVMERNFNGDDGSFRVEGFIMSERSAKSALAQGEKVVFYEGRPTFEESFGPLTLEVPYNAFLQTNTGVASALFKETAAQADLAGTRGNIWDLFCGVGSLALYLAKDLEHEKIIGDTSAGPDEKDGKDVQTQIFGLEIQKEAIRAARENAKRQGLSHCRFEAGDVAASLEALMRKDGFTPPDIIIVDPPRAGLGERLCRLLVAVPARKLIYISCDPGTLARDIKALASGWVPKLVKPFDMFPYTTHVETLVVLERQG